VLEAGHPTLPFTVFVDFFGSPRVQDSDFDGVGLPDMGFCESDEITGLRVGTGGFLTWEPHGSPGILYNLYRGLFSYFIATCYDELEHAGDCRYIQDPMVVPEARRYCSLGTTSFTDPDVPPPGDGFLYVVSGEDLTEGSLGWVGRGQERVNWFPCP
jgi:hypothetical protein